jgi:L-threonylcarbamoyladenylate synthase
MWPVLRGPCSYRSRRGKLGYGIESTIVSFREGGVFVHRHGAISIEELSEHVRIIEEERAADICESPGELPYHYAPMKPLRLVAGPSDARHEASSYLAFRQPVGEVRSRHVRILSPSGDLREAASNFFSALIELDRDDVDIIYAEKLPEKGIGRAVMERLRKAARKHPPSGGPQPVE